LTDRRLIMDFTWIPRIALLAGLVSFFAPGCSKKPGPEGTQPPVLKVGHVGHDHQIALFVAALEGEKFKKQFGLWLKEKKAREVYDLMEGEEALAELHVIKVGGGARMPASMERGEIDVGYGGVAAVAFFRDKGNPFKILCPLHTGGDMLVVRPDLPVKDWASFVEHVKSSQKPLKIGYKAPVAVAKLIFMRALEESGISYRVGDPAGQGVPPGGAVELVNLQGGKNMVPSLASGAVDGFVMNQPQVSMAVAKKVGKVVADLADLPPAGKWKDHPCCCIAASEAVIAAHRPALKALMKLTLLATQWINEDKNRASELASTWTKVPLEVERDSVPSITYVAEFTDSWKKGMIVWADIMNEIGKFTKDLKGRTGNEFLELCCDTSLIEEGAKDLREAGKLK